MRFKEFEKLITDIIKADIPIPNGLSAIINETDYNEIIPPQNNLDDFGRFGVELNVKFLGKDVNVFLVNEKYVKTKKL
jgi:hypothetical protein